MAGESSVNPDLDWVERFGAVFEWTAPRHREMNRAFRLAVKRKRIAVVRQKPGRFYLLFYAMTVFGVMASVIVLLTLSRQDYLESSSNLTAGVILGATAVGCAFWTNAFIEARRPHVADPHWVYTSIRVGVDRDVLWIYKHGTISIFAAKDAFISVKRFDRFIGAYVSPYTAHYFPTDVLKRTRDGRKVLDWFEAHWPSDIASASLGRAVPRRGILKRMLRGLVRALCLVGIVLIAIEACLFLGSGLQGAIDAVKRPSANTPAAQDASAGAPATRSDPNLAAPTLSGSGATRFIERLIHPGTP